MYNFDKLIKKYSKVPPQHLTGTTEGHYDYSNGGEWVEGTGTWSEFDGAVVPLDKDDLTYKENNPYTSEDRKLYTYTTLKLGEKIRHKDLEYTIQEMSDYSDFNVGLGIYYMKKGV